MSQAKGDAALRQFERDMVIACMTMAVLALLLTGAWKGRGPAVRVALGVLGGGLLVAFSYRAIKDGVNALVGIAIGARVPVPGDGGGPAAEDGGLVAVEDGAGGAVEGSSRAGLQPRPTGPMPPVLSAGRRVFLAVKFFTRYALLAVAAYVMLTCLRLHPAGLLVGVSSPFVAAVVEVGRLSRARRPHS